MLRARGTFKVDTDLVREVWAAVPSEVKLGLLAIGLRDPGDLTTGQLAWLLPLASTPPVTRASRTVH